MAKVTLNVNLFPCTRDLPNRPYKDLTENLLLAKKLCKAATQLFWLQRGTVNFSGYTWEGDEGITIHLWHKDRLFRTVRILGLSYSAVLHVDVTALLLREAMGWDLFGELCLTEDGVIGAEIVLSGRKPPLRMKGTNRSGPRRNSYEQRWQMVERLVSYLETGQ